MKDSSLKDLFLSLYFAETETDVEKIVASNSILNNQTNWHPYGEDENYFGVIENQQASPIPALVEKITNSIDAVLMRKCRELGIDPKASDAPKSMDAAVVKFYPDNSWDLRQFQRQQAEHIQIIANGPKDDTSLIIYDNGEGQHPENFEQTFLSLLKGNKTEIHFVQGKFNMGGSGALVFCGKSRFQLIGSKKFDNSGNFGFTLIRRHKRTAEEQRVKRHTWYEFFKVNKQIAQFNIDSLDLKLFNRQFTTGTIIKLFSYRMKGITDISRDLNLSLNEYLFEPALPVYTIEDPKRYPKTPQMQRELFGLKRRLDKQGDTYLDKDWNFSETYTTESTGPFKVSVFVFRSRIEGKNAKDSKTTIRREFFKNNMSVIYCLNGQVHAFESTVFISQALDFQLLKDHLLIQIDCSKMLPEFRDELFMASRDRLKEGDESKELKNLLIKNLTKSKLSELYKFRKDNLALESESASDLLKDMAQSLNFNKELMSLIQQTFKLQTPKKDKPQPSKDRTKESKSEQEEIPFQPKRFPTLFKLKHNQEGIPIVQVPLGGEKLLRFETDVENEYFDRIDEPGDLQISVLAPRQNETTGGNALGEPSQPSSLMNIIKTSPDKGTIKIYFNPTNNASVGDSCEVKATLTNPGGDFEQYFMVKVVSPDQPKQPKPKEVEAEEPAGLPPYILVYKEAREGSKSFDDLEAANISMDFANIMHPHIEGGKLDKIFVNMDSHVLKSYKTKYRGEKQLMMADRKYISSVYFHTLMLFAITKQKKYEFTRIENGESRPSDLTEYLKDIFESHYSSFLLNFGMSEIMQNIEQ